MYLTSRKIITPGLKTTIGKVVLYLEYMCCKVEVLKRYLKYNDKRKYRLRRRVDHNVNEL